ncbi:hypothetical protein AAFC00_005078 [Neodothiora populina]|uniref:Conserved oligomeric Golgi complex subunit 1 n=1 Tax=Neodothiora populina TaxID=2781224 RepID=A0ABR3PKT7_9PEZI
MTTQAPNPRDFQSWEDAFQYPVPVVRRLEQQLRGSINENRDKLRTLVGTSYRDLVGTAERIIEMDGQMHEAEELLGEIGRKCNARTIERIATSHSRIVKSQRDQVSPRNALASSIALLQSCLAVGSRTIKQKGSSLLVARLVVLARLLHSSVSKTADASPLLDTLRTRLASLRRRALNYVDGILAKGDTDRDALTEALAAFSLATTSTPTDVLRHFLNVRAEALTELLEEPAEAGVHSAMALLLSTLKEAQAMFPHRLSELLSQLQDEPLLRGEAVRATSELNLDIYERWIADDVRNFTPFLRHDQLQGTQATKLIQSWATSAKQKLLEGLQRLLSSTQDAQKVVALRKDVISRSLSANKKLPGLDQAAFFEDLRACFSSGLRHIATEAANDLVQVADQFLGDTASVNNATELLDIWDHSLLDLDLTKGAVELRDMITNVSEGRDNRLQDLHRQLKSWASRLADVSVTIKTMREDRWDDDLELDLDDDLELSAPPDLLTREDPKSLDDLLNEQRNQALTKVYEKIQSTMSDNSGSENPPAFVLRLLREVVQHSSSTETSSVAIVKPPPSLLELLHNQLAQQVISQNPSRSSRLITFTRAPAITLWEGSPALPMQPSPASCRFLYDTCKTMDKIGVDLWTPRAVAVLKARLRDLVAETLDETLLDQAKANGAESTGQITNGASNHDVAANGTSADAEVEEKEAVASTKSNHEFRRMPKLTQAMYDVLYLEKILSLHEKHEVTAFDRVLNQLRESLHLEESAWERLRKSTSDHHRRTYLLFGLLAV